MNLYLDTLKYSKSSLISFSCCYKLKVSETDRIERLHHWTLNIEHWNVYFFWNTCTKYQVSRSKSWWIQFQLPFFYVSEPLFLPSWRSPFNHLVSWMWMETLGPTPLLHVHPTPISKSIRGVHNNQNLASPCQEVLPMVPIMRPRTQIMMSSDNFTHPFPRWSNSRSSTRHFLPIHPRKTRPKRIPHRGNTLHTILRLHCHLRRHHWEIRTNCPIPRTTIWSRSRGGSWTFVRSTLQLCWVILQRKRHPNRSHLCCRKTLLFRRLWEILSNN